MSRIIKVFDFTDYKAFLRATLHEMPKRGHGQSLRIAQALGVHTTMVTHILKGNLHLGAEQSLALAEFLGLSDLETRYFAILVQWARAGDLRTRNFFEKQIADMKVQSANLRTRLQIKNILEEPDQAVYYSSWLYSAIRLLSAIPKYQSALAMAEYFALPIAKINKALEFLLSRGLCEEKNGKIVYGQVSTYLDQSSPLAIRHHANWRLKAIEQFENLNTAELVFTSPVVVSEKDLPKIREALLSFIEEFKKVADPSPSEKLFCLNVDWVEVR